jgi:hypothetical protein
MAISRILDTACKFSVIDWGYVFVLANHAVEVFPSTARVGLLAAAKETPSTGFPKLIEGDVEEPISNRATKIAKPKPKLNLNFALTCIFLSPLTVIVIIVVNVTKRLMESQGA